MSDFHREKAVAIVSNCGLDLATEMEMIDCIHVLFIRKEKLHTVYSAQKYVVWNA